jgi:membrane fusion protein (multidrug efflux system)
MKRSILIAVLAFVIIGGSAWLFWRKPAGSAEDEARPETQVAVHVGKLRRATLRAYVTAYGVVEPEPPGERPAASARVTAALPGVVSLVQCAEGQRVEKGALLFQLDSRIADAAVAKARSADDLAEATLARQKKLIQVEGTSQKLVLEAEQARATAHSDLVTAEAQQALLRVTAPLGGTVTHVNVKPGEAVDPATTLADIVDLGRLVVSAAVPSAELGALKLGRAAELLLDGETAPLRGTLSYVGAQVDAKSGTAPVRVAFAAHSALRPGQLVTLRIISAEHKDCLAVPAEAVVKDETGVTVLALVQDDKATQRPVKVGLRDGDWVEVEGEGLAADMAVVTEGAYGLPKQTKIRVLGQ